MWRWVLRCWMVVCGVGWWAPLQAQTPSQSSSTPVSAEVLHTAQYQGKYTMQYLRLRRGTQPPAYAVWFPPVPRDGDTQHQGGAVLFSNPYAGIDWSGEAIDLDTFERAGRNQAFTVVTDIHGPGDQADEPTYIAYDYAVTDDVGGFALPFVMNGLGALIMFERFYAGGSLQQHIDGALTGLAFLHAQPGIQPRKVAIWGASWGGTISAYAAAQAPAASKPALGVAITPIIDLGRFVSYGQVLPSLMDDRFQASVRLTPYVRRALASALPDERPVLARYSAQALATGLTMPFLFMHDTLDMIAPYLHAAPLYDSAQPGLELLPYTHRDNTRDWRSFDVGHAPVQPGYEEGSALLLSWAYLLTRLSDAKDWILLPVMPWLKPDEFFAHQRRQATLGHDANRYLRPRLLELCDPRIFIVSYDNGFATPVWGRAWVADHLRRHWGLNVTAADVVTVLNKQGL